ncbi:hypothetical protein A8B78_09365 [Jannaschia sp. EhC01]|nr:hypothetical protein A8B78_09365 [Jannaschia sp. EhC01]
MRLAAPLALLLALPLSVLTYSAQAQEAPINWTCVLDILCPDVGGCRDWDQTITIVEGDDGWRVTWNDDLPSDYVLIGDYLPPEDAVEQVRVRTLMFLNERAQSSQMVTFDSTGHVVVTGHQPQAGTRVVTGLGTCEVAE